MIREIRTAEQLAELMKAKVGYLYNDFGGRDPKSCPIHAMGCASIKGMLRPATGKLGVPKLWSIDLDELVREVAQRGKVYAFCGNEPALEIRAASPSPSAPASAPARAPGVTSAGDADATASSTRPDAFRVDIEPSVVTVSSAYRLQFDDKPQTKSLKAAIGEAVERLAAGRDQILEAIYTSASPDTVDAENVLLYNVGTGRFAAAAGNGLRFERVYGQPAGGNGVEHHHRYALVAADSLSSHWRSCRMVAEASDVSLQRLDAMSKPDAVWLATREKAPAGARPHSGRYALDLTLQVARHDSVRPADIVKPLVDGLIAGLHAHSGRDAAVVTPRLAARLGLGVERVSALLHDETRAWLGTRRLLWPRADGIQWNPGDDECVSAMLRVRRNGGAEWRLAFALYEVEPLD